MVTLIILVVILIVGIYLSKSWDYEILGMFMTIVAAIALVFHSLVYFTVPYTYNQWVVQREAFAETLEDARKNGRELEAAAILREVATWNKELASAKYDNKTFFLDQYIDDRVEDLEPIK